MVFSLITYLLHYLLSNVKTAATILYKLNPTIKYFVCSWQQVLIVLYVRVVIFYCILIQCCMLNKLDVMVIKVRLHRLR